MLNEHQWADLSAFIVLVASVVYIYYNSLYSYQMLLFKSIIILAISICTIFLLLPFALVFPVTIPIVILVLLGYGISETASL